MPVQTAQRQRSMNLKPRMVRTKRGSVIFLHPCKICGANAPFGHGYSSNHRMMKKSIGEWYCEEHNKTRKHTSKMERR